MRIESTELYAAMRARGDFHDDAIRTIEAMREDVAFNGQDPEEVLHSEGFEPDYIFDILP